MQSLVDTLHAMVTLPLSEPMNFLLLHTSLNARISHFVRSVPYEALEPHAHTPQLAVWHGALQSMALPDDVRGVAEWAGLATYCQCAWGALACPHCWRTSRMRRLCRRRGWRRS